MPGSMAEFKTDVKHDFDLAVVQQNFEGCKQENDHLLLDKYLQAYHELNRFFRLTGRLFGFVAKDLEDKIGILEKHRQGTNGAQYKTIQAMVNYEVSNDITRVKGHLPSGSRTLLRLHRALEFILAFMDRLGKSKDEDKTSVIATEVYHETLARYHPWIVQKMAVFAVYMLPSRRVLLETMCKQNYEQTQGLLQRVIKAGYPVYHITQNLYAENKLLDLP